MTQLVPAIYFFSRIGLELFEGIKLIALFILIVPDSILIALFKGRKYKFGEVDPHIFAKLKFDSKP